MGSNTLASPYSPTISITHVPALLTYILLQHILPSNSTGARDFDFYSDGRLAGKASTYVFMYRITVSALCYLPTLPIYLSTYRIGRSEREGGMNFTSLHFASSRVSFMYVCMYLASASASTSILALCLKGTKQVRFCSTVYICGITSWQQHTETQNAH